MSKQPQNVVTDVIMVGLHYGCPVSKTFYQSTHLITEQTHTEHCVPGIARAWGLGMNESWGAHSLIKEADSEKKTTATKNMQFQVTHRHTQGAVV